MRQVIQVGVLEIVDRVQPFGGNLQRTMHAMRINLHDTFPVDSRRIRRKPGRSLVLNSQYISFEGDSNDVVCEIPGGRQSRDLHCQFAINYIACREDDDPLAGAVPQKILQLVRTVAPWVFISDDHSGIVFFRNFPGAIRAILVQHDDLVAPLQCF